MIEIALGAWLWLTPALAGDPDVYQRSYEQEALGAYAAAVQTLSGLSSRETSSYTAELRRAWLQYLSGQYDASISAYDRATRLHPDAIEPRLGKLLPLLALRRWADAERLGREILKDDPRSYLARSRTAWATYNLGRYADAEKLYREVLADYPSDVEMRAGLGWALLSQGDKAAAAREFDAVLRVSPQHASAKSGKDQAR